MMSDLSDSVTYLLMECKEGMTFEDLKGALKRRFDIDTYHGPLSGVLSVLHKEQEVFYLKQKRDNKYPYVHKRFRTLYAPSLRVDTPRVNKWRELSDEFYNVLKPLNLDNKQCTALLKKYEMFTNDD